MQQTEKYQLNLIERDDVFSPDALNENTQKLEEVISTGQAALDQRLTAVEVHKIATGIAPKNTTVNLGFTPAALMVFGYNGISMAHDYGTCTYATIVEGGFETKNVYSETTFQYLALA